MEALLEELRGRLSSLDGIGRRRRLEMPSGVDFASNDYLGLAADAGFAARIRSRLEASACLSAPASRLLRGQTPLHAELERRLAAFKGTEAALLMPSGFQANVGLLSAIVDRRDRVLSDRLNHASLIDGLRLSRAEVIIYPHLDARAVEQALAEPWPGRTFVVTESLFSMDGDIAPLERLAELCERYGALLIVDDAHATGLWGERGSGLLEHLGLERRALAITSTLGKSFGAAGAFIAGPATLVDFLVNACRPFIFSTAASPLLCHAALAGLEIVTREPGRRRRVHENAGRLRGHLRRAGLDTPSREGPIVPVILGAEERALTVAAELQRQGFDVRAVRPPTVPAGSSRLRLSVHADHDTGQIDSLASRLVAAVRATGAAEQKLNWQEMSR